MSFLSVFEDIVDLSSDVNIGGCMALFSFANVFSNRTFAIKYTMYSTNTISVKPFHSFTVRHVFLQKS